MSVWFLAGNGGIDIGDYYWGLYRDCYRDPFPHSLLSSRQLMPLVVVGIPESRQATAIHRIASAWRRPRQTGSGLLPEGTRGFRVLRFKDLGVKGFRGLGFGGLGFGVSGLGLLE